MKAELEESLLIFTAKVAKKFKPEIVCVRIRGHTKQQNHT